MAFDASWMPFVNANSDGERDRGDHRGPSVPRGSIER